MATSSLVDVRLLSGGYEVTSDHNQVSLSRSQDAVENTVFGSSSRTFLPGIKTAAYTYQGFFESDGTSAQDDLYAAQFVGTGAQVLTIVAPDGLVGATAYSFEGIHSEFKPFGGSIGDMAAFQVDGFGTGDSFRGKLIEDGLTARSSSSNSAGEQLVAITAAETGRASLHVIATTGSPTLDVVIQSDTSGFPSPTAQITFTQATAVGAQYSATTGTTSDDYWRVAWTFGGTGSITFAVNFGIA